MLLQQKIQVVSVTVFKNCTKPEYKRRTTEKQILLHEITRSSTPPTQQSPQPITTDMKRVNQVSKNSNKGANRGKTTLTSKS